MNFLFKLWALCVITLVTLIHESRPQECDAGTAVNVKGNWYCSSVDSISYTNFPGTGHYYLVTYMNTSTGACTTQQYDYTGSLSPLNEELALHVRGPTWLKQLAVYIPGPALTKRNVGKQRSRDLIRHNHGHHHREYRIDKAHGRVHEGVERAVGDAVTATIDCQVVTWINKYAGPVNEEAAQAENSVPHGVDEMVTATINGQIVSWTNQYTGPSTASSLNPTPVAPAPVETTTSQATTAALQAQAFSSSPTDAPAKTTPTTFSTVPTSNPANLVGKASSLISAKVSKASAYISAKASSVTATTPSSTTLPLATVHATSTSSSIPSARTTSSGTSVPSGSWRRQAYYNAAQEKAEGLVFLNHFGTAHDLPGFGASLSYASHDGSYGVETPQVLGNAMIRDNNEIVILSNVSCDDGKCGYTRPGGLAYHGFGGDHKIFLMEFSMPLTGETGFNADMPAIWIMNAKIALTSQYGENQACSCWSSGCGELDVFEVLDTGNTRCKSTLHMAPAGGSSDYFERPANASVKAAVVFYGRNDTAIIQLLDDIVTFDEVLTTGFLEELVADLPPPKKQSVFKLQADA
ncbi:MAG: hypothetical protein Q9195_003162 [Heterodermia aff. obscurata]